MYTPAQARCFVWGTLPGSIAHNIAVLLVHSDTGALCIAVCRALQHGCGHSTVDKF